MDGDSDREDDSTCILLERRGQLTESLLDSPYDLILYLERAQVHADLGYPDLAAGDSYRALLLRDELADESFEYHEPALETLKARLEEGYPSILRKRETANTDSYATFGVEHMDLDCADEPIIKVSKKAALRCYQNLSLSLLLCGCLKSAYEFCSRGLQAAPNDEDLNQVKDYIFNMAKRRLKVEEVDISQLPEQGLVRREVYPWNDHEPDRHTEESLHFLNKQLQLIAPKCEVRSVDLPTLVESAIVPDEEGNIPTNKQLGLFAKDDISPDETVLEEVSVLTVNNRLKDSLCDLCSAPLPPLGEQSTVVGCLDCDDTMFCNEECLDLALRTYHPAICEKDVDEISKDPDPKESPNALYLLLLSRSLAMSATQEKHPLDLKEVKYIWGDFLPSASNAVPISHKAEPPPVWTLPFTFASNISTPLHVLEKMDIDIFTSLASYDLWIFNTLYAKFRGTASARVNRQSGKPEVAAVHPLWCLANHDCDPNVQWEWGGRMKLWCRTERIGGRKGGIRKGEEILNHYCDISLPVQDRREWAEGSLGGWCMCERCRREAGEMDGGQGETRKKSSGDEDVDGIDGNGDIARLDGHIDSFEDVDGAMEDDLVQDAKYMGSMSGSRGGPDRRVGAGGNGVVRDMDDMSIDRLID